MKILNPQFDLERFWNQVHDRAERILLLDYDGTLAPFTTERDQAYPYPGVRDILDEILRSGRSRVVLISGRRIEDLVPLLKMDAVPEIWGSHGWERRRADGTYEFAPLQAPHRDALAEAAETLRRHGWDRLSESKPASVAVHWRSLPPQRMQEVREQLVPIWSDLATRRGLDLLEFDGGLEVRVPGRDKGVAVTTILAEVGPSATAYLGDDHTDEDAFASIRDHGGLAALVRKELRPTQADIWLKPPEELLEFLGRWRACCTH